MSLFGSNFDSLQRVFAAVERFQALLAELGGFSPSKDQNHFVFGDGVEHTASCTAKGADGRLYKATFMQHFTRSNPSELNLPVEFVVAFGVMEAEPPNPPVPWFVIGFKFTASGKIKEMVVSWPNADKGDPAPAYLRKALDIPEHTPLKESMLASPGHKGELEVPTTLDGFLQAVRTLYPGPAKDLTSLRQCRFFLFYPILTPIPRNSRILALWLWLWNNKYTSYFGALLEP